MKKQTMFISPDPKRGTEYRGCVALNAFTGKYDRASCMLLTDNVL